MANLPLSEDTLFQGVVYLKGETQYPKSLVDSIGLKAESIKMDSGSPIFRGNPTPQPAVEEPQALVIPTPGVPTQPEVNLGAKAGQGEEEEGLPEDLPYREFFEAAGISTLQEVRELEDVKNIEGIGPARAIEVRNYLESTAPAAEDED